MSRVFEAEASARIARPAAEVWARLREFGDLSWAVGKGVEGVEVEGDGIGMLRRVRSPAGPAPIVEQLTAFDDPSQSLTYAIIEGGIPGLDEYTATARVTSGDGGCEASWTCRARTGQPELLEALARGLVSVFAESFE